MITKIDDAIATSKMKETMPKGVRKTPKKGRAKSSATVQIKIGPRKLTRFERARVVGARALQIAMGAPVLIDVSPQLKSPIDIALMELEERVLPMTIRRSLPDGTSQNIPLRLLDEAE